MFITISHNSKHYFDLEVPYSIDEINAILNQHTFYHKKRFSSPSLFRLDTKTYIGYYDEHGFRLSLNPKKPAGYYSNLDTVATLHGQYEEKDCLTIIKSTLVLEHSLIFLLSVIFGISLLFFFIALACNVLYGGAVFLLMVLMDLAISKFASHTNHKNEDRFRQLFN